MALGDFNPKELMHTQTSFERAFFNMPFESVLGFGTQFFRQAFDYGYLMNPGKNVANRTKSFLDSLRNIGPMKSWASDAAFDWSRIWKPVAEDGISGIERVGRIASAAIKTGPLAALSAVDLGVATVGQAARTTSAFAGGVAGGALNLAMLPVIGLAAGAGYLGFKAAKLGLKAGAKMAPYAAKGAVMAGKHIGSTAMGLGKLAWDHRRSKILGTAFILGATIFGAARGNKEAQMNASMGMINPNMQRPAWAIQGGANPRGYSKLDGQYRSFGNVNGTSIDDLGATGDLVFALNNIRNGG